MAEPTSKDMATLVMAALIFVLDKDQPSAATSFGAAKEFVEEAEKQIPGVFDDA